MKNKFLFRRSARRADLLLTVSPFSRDEIVRHFGILEGAIKITPNGVTLPASGMVLPDVKNKFGLDRFIMTVSRIEPRKNQQLLLQAWVELKLYDQGIKLVFVGEQSFQRLLRFATTNSERQCRNGCGFLPGTDGFI